MTKNIHRIFFITFFVALAIIGAALWLKISVNYNKEIAVLEVSDLKQGENFQFRDIAFGISLEKLKDILPSENSLTEIRPEKEIVSTETYLMMGEKVSPIYKFENDKLERVQLVYHKKNQKKLFQQLVEELTNVFGLATESTQDVDGDWYYTWHTENSVIQVNTVSRSTLVFFIYRK